jgi:hypothetical protein
MTGGPKAARPGIRQAQIVAENIAKLASGDGANEKLGIYKPDVAGIDLSLGLVGFILNSIYACFSNSWAGL